LSFAVEAFAVLVLLLPPPLTATITMTAITTTPAATPPMIHMRRVRAAFSAAALSAARRSCRAFSRCSLRLAIERSYGRLFRVRLMSMALGGPSGQPSRSSR
jgi:hypothetical protein